MSARGDGGRGERGEGEIKHHFKSIMLVVVVWSSVVHCSRSTQLNYVRVRLVLGWVTVSGFNYWCWTYISVCNQPPRSTQPSIPLGSVNEYQLWLERKSRYGSFR